MLQLQTSTLQAAQHMMAGHSRSPWATFALLLLITLAQLQLSSAALNAYAYMKGTKQGDIKGSVTQRGREDSIAVIAVNDTISSADSTPGAPGKPVHGPYTITKELDKSTPLLYNAFVNGEVLSEVTIRFWTPQLRATSGTGSEVQHFTVTLTNAIISGMTFTMLNNKNPELMRYAEYEQIDLTYQKIQWTWNDGGITAEATNS